MFCPCAGSYFTVEGPQTETPRLIRSKDDRVPFLTSRAPLPVQIRPQSARKGFQREYGQAQANMYEPGKVPAILITTIPEEPEVCDDHGCVSD